jgi:hypothetical protein
MNSYEKLYGGKQNYTELNENLHVAKGMNLRLRTKLHSFECK